MDGLEIAHRRLHGQRLSAAAGAEPEAVVSHLGAIQAQEYAVAKWSVGQRTSGHDEAAVQRAVDEGRILRTHVLRPTWHFVAAADIRWIQALTAPRVHAFNGSYYRGHGLDDEHAERAAKAFTEVLRGGNHLTRKELAAALAKVGIDATGNRLAYVVMRAELDGLIANGAMRGKQHTYALISERVPDTVTMQPDEALAELTRRYFTSHGPATVRDFSWWSSLTAAQIRRGLELVGSALVSEKVDRHTFWYAPSAPSPSDPSPMAHVLQGYDELFVAYTESRPMANLAGHPMNVPNENALVHPIVVDSQFVGFWRRVVDRTGVVAEVAPATRLTARARKAVEAAFARYATFAGVPVIVQWPR